MIFPEFRKWHEANKDEMKVSFKTEGNKGETFTAFCRRIYQKDQQRFSQERSESNDAILHGDETDFFLWACIRKGRNGELTCSFSLENPEVSDLVFSIWKKNRGILEVHIPEYGDFTHYPFEKSIKGPGMKMRINKYKRRR